MDKYLTKKARPGKILNALEIAVAFLLTVVLVFFGAAWLSDIAAGVFEPALHIALLGLFSPFALLLVWLLSRKRKRKQAAAIIAALSTSKDGHMECERLEKITGIRKISKVVVRLTASKYLCDVVEVHGEVRLANRNLMQAVCAYCGASLLFRSESSSKCPNCGANTIKC